ncbi:hypothetical protein LTR84_006756 [Exophiala bonariae]|uniref:BZIP domain-containing protein n=1 Tax=Exophiala bonariae TaxID=1690606 RepID=A0AAV9N2F7_9EURO|nr:hypothetical protein LTR84_006756 [Exophiala bonariae]
MEDADLILRRRRDNGKVAQRNFRTRQAEKASELKQNYEQLKRIVETIVLAHGEHDQAKLNDAIAQAGQATGLEVVERCALSTSPKASIVVAKRPGLVHGSAVAASAQPTTRDIYRESFYQPRSGRFSPRLGYGIWLEPERFLKILDPPLDILPYVGAGKYTVAGRIAWASLDYGYACLQEAMIARATNTIPKDDWIASLPPESAARRAFDRSLRHSKPLHDVAYMMDLVEARIEFREQGYMRGNTRGGDEVSRQVMQGSVAHDLRARRVRMDQWWTALDIEAHLQAVMGVDDFSALQIALCSQEADQAQMFMPLARSLGHNGVCFGDGPRWHAPSVKALVSAWLDQISVLGVW